MYLKFSEKTITNFSDDSINSLYNEGYVFTRVGKGVMNQTRSLRIDLAKFELSSENKRILKKTDSLLLTPYSLPFAHYTWQIGKMAKDFYETKFGEGTFSANKIKELMTDKEKSDFNLLLAYGCHSEHSEESLKAIGSKTNVKGSFAEAQDDSVVTGYTICRETNELLHYSYPFYSLLPTPYSLGKDTGLGMMIRAIIWAKENNKKYTYLGSASRPTDTYKLQFKGVEWFNEKNWSDDLEKLKNIL